MSHYEFTLERRGPCKNALTGHCFNEAFRAGGDLVLKSESREKLTAVQSVGQVDAPPNNSDAAEFPVVLIEAISDEAAEPLTANLSRALALERENNLLPWRIDMLSGASLEALDRLLIRICRHPDRVSNDALSGACLLQAALVTGRPVKTLATLPIFMIEPSTIKAQYPPGLYCGRKEWAWWIPAGKPTSTQVVPSGAERLYRPVQSNMLIWCGDRTQQLCRNALKRRAWRLQQTDEESSTRSFYRLAPPKGCDSWTTDLTRKLTSAALNLLEPSQRHGLSAKRVENWLFSKLVEETGEFALAAIITDRVTSQSNAVVHYSWVSCEKALRLRHDLASCHELIDHDGPNSTMPELRAVPAALIQADCGFGSRFAMTSAAVTGLAEKLRSDMANITYRSYSKKFHNYFTLYTIALLGFAAGLRPGNAPIPNYLGIDLKDGFLVWNDKNRSVDERDRLLWLPQIAIDQVKYYREHIQYLRKTSKSLKIYSEKINRLSHSQLTYTHRILNETMKDKNSWSFSVAELTCESIEELECSPFLFEGGILKRATPKMVAAAFASIGYPIQVNAWRHYLRTELIGQLSGDVLLAFMGHWQRGQDPWDVYSALSPMTYREALQEHVEGLLQFNGWTAIEGLGQQPIDPEPLGIPVYSKNEQESYSGGEHDQW